MNKFISITLLNTATATSEISWNSKRWALSEEQAIVSILISFSLIAIQEKESRSGRDVFFPVGLFGLWLTDGLCFCSVNPGWIRS